MLTWLKSLVTGPKRIEDPVFGSLLYMGDYWEGRGRFEPTQEQIEWLVTAGEEGPGDAQHSFFRSVCARYTELRLKAHSAIHAATTPASGAALRLVAIEVPASPSQSSTWELSFEAEASHNAVQFIAWEPSGSVEVSQ